MVNLLNSIKIIAARLRTPARRLAHQWRRWRAAAIYALAAPMARRRSPWRLVSRWPQQMPLLIGRVALFAHHDSQGIVGDYVFGMLAALKESGFQIVFCSNAGRLEIPHQQRLQTLCEAVLIRQNLGGPWGAWREALHEIGEHAITQLVLTSDDYYGPFADLTALLRRNGPPVWSLTDSWRGRWHLQPGLISVDGAVLRHPAWQAFWSQLPATNLKTLLHRDGDVAFSQRLLGAGFTLQPVWRFSDLCARVELAPAEPPKSTENYDHQRYLQLRRIDDLIQRQVPFDPTQLLWRQLLQAGDPLLSRTLFHRNPDGARDLFDCRTTLATLGYSFDSIRRDLTAPTRPRRSRTWSLSTALKNLNLSARWLVRKTREAASLALSLPRSPLQARAIWPSHAATIGRRVAVFAHFDSAGEIRPDVRCYLAALHDAGVSIVFVSNAERLQPEALEALKPLCAAVVVRRNIGYDFGAWREGLAYLRGSLDDIDWLALINDSVYAPIVPLAPLLDRLDFTKADIWGFTSSDQLCDHLQSYFLAVSRRVMRSPAWRDFWKGVRPVNSKSWAIAHGELRFSQAMRAAGFHMLALFPHTEAIATLDPNPEDTSPQLLASLRQRRRRILAEAVLEKRTLNPTADLWRELLAMGFPFIKRELLRLNPTRVADSLDWRGEIEPRNPELAALIEADLRRSVKGKIV